MANVNNFDTAAWSIDGARHRGELLRSFAYAATGGREGVVTAADCRVSQTSTPGPTVQISAGAVAMRNRSAGAVGQSYVVENRANSTVDVPAPGGTARSYLVIVRAKDPQYSPWKTIIGTSDPATFQYVEPMVIGPVSATTTSVAQVAGVDYSAYALARIDMPAGTTAVTQSMIHDLRTIIQPAHDPEEARTVRVWTPSVDAVQLLAGHTTRQWFPRTNELIYCPPWATRATLMVTLNSLKYQGAQCWGNIQAEYGWNSDDSLLTTIPSGFHNEGLTDRKSLTVAGSFAIPASFRDKSHFVRTGAVMDINRSGDAIVTQDNWSTVIVDLQFEEVAD